MPDAVHVVVPGDLQARTGGYEYDRQIIAGLRRRGRDVVVLGLPGTYPDPTPAERAEAGRVLSAVPDGACVVIDGLAFGVLPREAARQRQRLRLIALVHHPLGLETGLARVTADTLLATERRALETVRGVVVTSPRTVGDVLALGVPPSRIAVVEPGTDPAPESPGSSATDCELLCVASLVPRKGIDTLFDALEHLTHLPWHLTCVGSAERHVAYASRLAERAARGPLAGRVTLPGELAGAPLDTLWRRTDVFVLPTHYEGYGMVVAEALARAIPVVSTPTGAIADLVGTDAGILVPTGDAAALAQALELLLSSHQALARVREGARLARLRVPTWDTAAVRMEEALARFAAA